MPDGSNDRSAGAPTALAITEGLRQHVDRSPFAIAVLEQATHVVCYANPAFLRLSGAPETRILGGVLEDVLPAPDAGWLEELFRQVYERGEPQLDVELETASLGVAEDPIVWRVTVWPVPEHGGHPDYLMLQLSDVTGDVRERRRRTALLDELREVNERLLLAALREEALKDQAQAASVAKSAFLATMSHELRTPLAAIIGYEELLADGITGPVTDAQRTQLTRIKSSASHLLALIDEVLTLARVEARQEIVRRQPVRVADVVGDATALVTPLAAAKGLALTLDVPEAQPEGALTLHTDLLKVRQILVNLLGNAVKYTDRGGIALTVRASGNAVVFEVRDTGIGIPPEHLEQVFDTFWQVHQTTTRTAGGTGLGLSVSRRLARLLGGDVVVASMLGRGSTFTFWLPRETPVTGAANETGAAGADPAE